MVTQRNRRVRSTQVSHGASMSCSTSVCSDRHTATWTPPGLRHTSLMGRLHKVGRNSPALQDPPQTKACSNSGYHPAMHRTAIQPPSCKNSSTRRASSPLGLVQERSRDSSYVDAPAGQRSSQHRRARSSALRTLDLWCRWCVDAVKRNYALENAQTMP